MNTKQRIKRLSWREVEGLSAILARAVLSSGFEPDYLIGIALGGLVPLALLAKRLGIRNTATISAHSYDAKTKKRGRLIVSPLPSVNLRGARVVLVDEIADSGKTLARVASLLKSRGVRELKTAVLIVNARHCRVRPDFSAADTDRWVVFPWET